MTETTSLQVEFLFRMHLDVGTSTMLAGAPGGTRIVAPVVGGTFEGPKLRGTVGPAPAGDWVTVRADGSMALDVRLILTTDDGAAILVTYSGIMRKVGDALQARGAPLFETGDERYAWLNGVLGVGIGTAGADGVDYDVYALP
ncbi:MAG: DUF3237 domain-containing protein [Frankia sp.]|nr:DUF3237 domain-containing protein [Frankia sp.]